MKRSTPLSRPTANLSDSLHQQLNKYALAAGAAGVSLLALAQPSDAKVVYTPANVVLNARSAFLLDLNHDGVPDFYFVQYPWQNTAYLGTLLEIQNGKNQSNHWIGSLKGKAEPLLPGFSIGPADGSKFRDEKVAAMAAGAWYVGGTSRSIFAFLWAQNGKGVKRRYLGLKFMINGEVHYGWARLSVTFPRVPHAHLRAVLTGYAYETIANKAISAGQTTGADKGANLDEARANLSAPTPQPATLSLLALGAPGLAIWRPKESSPATN
jgi:hypothetical protein